MRWTLLTFAFAHTLMFSLVFSACDSSNGHLDADDSIAPVDTGMDDAKAGDVTNYFDDTTTDITDDVPTTSADTSLDSTDKTLDTFDTAEPPPEQRSAWIFIDNPDENDGQPSQTTLTHFTDPDGHLTGQFAEVWNCLNQPGGPQVDSYWGGQEIWIDLCVYAQTVLPGEDGSYLHVLPPEDMTDPNDSFAEVQMYSSINRIHDYYANTMGYSERDRSLFAVVNIQTNLLSGDHWMPLDNAAFIPDGRYGFDGFNMHNGELIAFGQGSRTDFAYESDVTFHEYTHFVVGPERLYAYMGDEWGFGDDPIAINEGFADYFPSSFSNDPILGAFALNHYARDLREFRKCPDDYVGESHYDGQIWSSSLWEIRDAIGAQITDELAFETLLKCSTNTTMEEVAALLVDTTEDFYPEHIDTVTDVLNRHGVSECQRLLDYGPATANRGYYVEGTWTCGIAVFHSWVPAPFQYRVDVPDGTKMMTVKVRSSMTSGSLTGMGGSSPVLRLAISRGDNPIQYQYYPKFSPLFDTRIDDPEPTASTHTFVVSGTCLAGGTYYVQVLNKTISSVYVESVDVEFSDVEPDGKTTYEICVNPPAPDAIDPSDEATSLDSASSSEEVTDIIESTDVSEEVLSQ